MNRRSNLCYLLKRALDWCKRVREASESHLGAQFMNQSSKLVAAALKPTKSMLTHELRWYRVTNVLYLDVFFIL